MSFNQHNFRHNRVLSNLILGLVIAAIAGAIYFIRWLYS